MKGKKEARRFERREERGRESSMSKDRQKPSKKTEKDEDKKTCSYEARMKLHHLTKVACCATCQGAWISRCATAAMIDSAALKFDYHVEKL